MALMNSADNSQPYRPFPDFGGTAYTNYAERAAITPCRQSCRSAWQMG
jgi:hypothetical protein